MSTTETTVRREELYKAEPHGAVLTEAEFLADFAHEAKKVRKGEVFSQAMVFFPDEKGEAVAEALKGASIEAKRTLVIDAYSYLAMDNRVSALAALNPFDIGSLIKRMKKYNKIVQDLRDSGVTVDEINKPHGIKAPVKIFFPFVGTNHTKGTYVFNKEKHEASASCKKPDNSTTFYLSTANHEDEPRMNMVIKYSGPLALALKEEYEAMHKNPPKEDYSKQLSSDTWLFVDSGIPEKSIILRKADELVAGAQKSVQAATLLYPDGKFANSLQGKYNQWKEEEMQSKEFDVVTSQFYPDFPLLTVEGTFYLVDKRARLQAKKNHFTFPVLADNTRWSHSKCLITDNKWLFIGSHNYASSGVKAGTREWQILTSNPEIVQAAQRMFRDYKAQVLATAVSTSKESQLL